MDIREVPVVDLIPKGYVSLGYYRDIQTDLGAMFEHMGKGVWIPKRTLRFAHGRYCAPAWAVRNSKKFQQGIR